MRLSKQTRTKCHSNQKGSLLIGLIITMVILSTLSGALVYLTTGATYEEVLANQHNRAYYIAESGGRYAAYLIANHQDIYNVPDFTPDPATQLHFGDFVLSNGDFFNLVITQDANDAEYLRVDATGTVNAGSWSETNRLITYRIKKGNPLGSSDGTPTVSFDGNEDSELDTTWNISPGTDAEIVSTGPSDGPALVFQGETGSLSLDWQDKENLNLVDAWTISGGLLNYEMQVKIGLDREGNKGGHYMFGLSFRVNTVSDSCYGISFFRSDPPEIKPNGSLSDDSPDWINPSATTFGDDFQTIRDGDIYAVLWLKESGSYSLLAYRKLYPADGVLQTDRFGTLQLKPWSTLLVKVEETQETIGSETVRQNYITGYIQAPDADTANEIYPRDSTPLKWSSDTYESNGTETNVFNQVQWYSPPAATIDDTTLTSEDFDTLRPDEIGVHAFYDIPANNDQFFDDFGLKVAGLGGGSNGMVQY